MPSTNPSAFIIGNGTSFTNSNLLYASGSNVQITGSATNSLRVKGSGTTSATTSLRIENANATASFTVLDDGDATIRSTLNTNFINSPGGGTIRGFRFIEGSNIHSLQVGYGSISQFELRTANGAVLALRATNTGLIGIGTTSPTTLLDVAGTGRFRNSVQVTGSLSISGSLLIGENSSSLYTSRTTVINSGSTDLYSIPTSSYDAVYFDYVIKSGSNARAGQVFSTYITTASTYIDNSTSDIGNTSVFYFSSSISSSNLVLHGSTTSDGWKVKTIIRGL
jgi:hypothetical protein